VFSIENPERERNDIGPNYRALTGSHR